MFGFGVVHAQWNPVKSLTRKGESVSPREIPECLPSSHSLPSLHPSLKPTCLDLRLPMRDLKTGGQKEFLNSLCTECLLCSEKQLCCPLPAVVDLSGRLRLRGAQESCIGVGGAHVQVLLALKNLPSEVHIGLARGAENTRARELPSYLFCGPLKTGTSLHCFLPHYPPSPPTKYTMELFLLPTCPVHIYTVVFSVLGSH